MTDSTTAHVREAAMAGIVGAAIALIGGVVVQAIVQPSSSVSDELWSYPFSSDAYVVASLLFALGHGLVGIGLWGLWRSGVAGRSRGARAGLALAMVATALLLVAQAASIAIRDARLDDTSAGVTGALFGAGTLLSALGFLIAGKATLSAGLWRDWRRFTLLVAGVCSTALLGLAPTKALPTGIALYSASLLVLWIGLYTQPAGEAGHTGPHRSAPSSRAAPSSAVG